MNYLAAAFAGIAVYVGLPVVVGLTGRAVARRRRGHR